MKKIGILALTICFVICFFSFSAGASGNTDVEYMLIGDVNTDGRIDVIDATFVQRIVVGLENASAAESFAGDCDDSGKTDVVDATLIQRFAAGMDVSEAYVGQYLFNPLFSYSPAAAIPSYWEKSVNAAENTFRSLAPSEEQDGVSFVVFGDTHIGSGVRNYSENIGLLAQRVMDDLQVHYCVCLGDMNYRFPRSDIQQVRRDIAASDAVMSPIRQDDLLICRGNHDYFFGTDPSYGKCLAREEINSLLFDKYRTDPRRSFGGDGSYFYLDDAKSKTRLIVMNCVNSVYSVDEDNNLSFDAFRKLGYGNAQLNWLANEALNIGDGWSAVIFQHYPPTWGYGKSPDTGIGIRDLTVFVGIVNAFCSKTVYRGSYSHDLLNGEGTWADVSVEADFRNNGAEMIGVFCGHRHIDSIYTAPLRCPIFVTTCAMSGGSDTEKPRRYGTSTETALDIVTVNKQQRTVSLVRLGVRSTDSHDKRGVRTAAY